MNQKLINSVQEILQNYLAFDRSKDIYEQIAIRVEDESYFASKISEPAIIAGKAIKIHLRRTPDVAHCVALSSPGVVRHHTPLALAKGV